MNQPWPTLTWINPLRPTLSPDLHILYISEIWQWWNWGPLSSTGGGGRTSLRIFHPPSQLGLCWRSLPAVIAGGHHRRSSPAVIAGSHRQGWDWDETLLRIQLPPVKSSLCKQPSWMNFLLAPFIVHYPGKVSIRFSSQCSQKCHECVYTSVHTYENTLIPYEY